MKKFQSLSFLIFIFVSTYCFAQMDQYKRKSISFVDVIYYTGVHDIVSRSAEDNYLSILQRNLILKRFDNNRIPDQISEKLRSKLSDSDDMDQTLETVLLPEIQKILDVQKEIRAREFLDEAEKNSFIALKAKEYGIASDHMVEVMNAAYILLPFISDLDAKIQKADDDDEEDKMHVSVDGGLIIYKVNYEGDYSISRLNKITVSSSSSKEKKSGSWTRTKDKAFVATASMMALNLKTELQKMEDFKLKAQLRKVKTLHVKFPLGEREGLKLDRPYYVGEWRQRQSGEKYFVKDGFVRIGDVADNYNDPRALSTAYVIHKGDWARGMTLVEHPTLGVDLSFKPKVFPMEIDSGFFYPDDKHPAVYIGSQKKENHGGLQMDLNINIAEATGKLQSFFVLGGAVSFLNMETSVFNKDEWTGTGFTPPNIEDETSFLYNIHLGYLRKNYLGPVALRREFTLGVQGLFLNEEYEIGDDKLNINALGFGGSVNLGLEFALTIDCNIGIYAGYDYYPGLNLWTMKYDRDDDDDEENFDLETWHGVDFPTVSNTGPTFGIYFHYSLPSAGKVSPTAAADISKEALNAMLF